MKYLLALLLSSLVLSSRGYPQPHIVGGDNARLGQYPYQVSLRFNGRHFCGGSIINNRHILTAGHCVLGKLFRIEVHAGTNYLSRAGDVYYSESTVTPAYYDEKGTIQNDVALIRVSRSIKFNYLVQPIRLANSEVWPGATVVASGWGRLWNEGQVPDMLQHINLTVIANAQCRRYYRSVQMNNVCTLTRRGQGVCKGDSGSPLVMNGVQVGVVSYGTICASGYPDVYAKVSDFTSWIGLQTTWTGGSINQTYPFPGEGKGDPGAAGLPLPSAFLIFLLLAIAHALR